MDKDVRSLTPDLEANWVDSVQAGWPPPELRSGNYGSVQRTHLIRASCRSLDHNSRRRSRQGAPFRHTVRRRFRIVHQLLYLPNHHDCNCSSTKKDHLILRILLELDHRWKTHRLYGLSPLVRLCRRKTVVAAATLQRALNVNGLIYVQFRCCAKYSRRRNKF